MQDKLEQIKEKYLKLQNELADPKVIADHRRAVTLNKAVAELSPVVEAYDRFCQTQTDLAGCRQIIDDPEADPELRELAEMEAAELSPRLVEQEHEIKLLLLPKDVNDDKNIIMEIRAGTGGDEAALFGAALYRMYQRYAERNKWRIEALSGNITEIGGVKEVVFSVAGSGVYSRLKYESGTHRVQRVPETESGGRIHTSAATVAVMPDADEVEVAIEAADLKIDVFRSSGPGGQSVNTTDSAVRITHKPTGVVVTCQDEKSQHKNKAKAMRILKSHIYERLILEQSSQAAEVRRLQVGTGDRSGRIRTYNYPQGRVTDHRINLTLYRLPEIMEGNIDLVIDTLITSDQADRLKLIADE